MLRIPQTLHQKGLIAALDLSANRVFKQEFEELSTEH